MRRRELLKHKFLAYSPKLDGVFCLYCTLFGQTEVGHGKVASGTFVNIPFKRYTHWKGEIAKHEDRDYHGDSTVRAESFIENEEITTQLETSTQRQIAHNRQVLKPIIKSILFLERCGVVLRGYRDTGRIEVPASCTEISCDERNLRALLQFKAGCAEILHCHLESNAGNAQYISNNSQTDIINSIGSVILKSVAEVVNFSRYFSILADETTDVAGQEQLTVVVRYVFEGQIKEQLYDS